MRYLHSFWDEERTRIVAVLLLVCSGTVLYLPHTVWHGSTIQITHTIVLARYDLQMEWNFGAYAEEWGVLWLSRTSKLTTQNMDPSSLTHFLVFMQKGNRVLGGRNVIFNFFPKLIYHIFSPGDVLLHHVFPHKQKTLIPS